MTKPALLEDVVPTRKTPATINRVYDEDRSAHDWYRFVLSFPPHLVREYLSRFEIGPNHLVLDPFCGTGTTLVECKKLGVPSVGVEALPMTCFASRAKTDWTPDPKTLVAHAEKIASRALVIIEKEPRLERKYRLTSEAISLLLKNSISPRPCAKSLLLLQLIRKENETGFLNHELLAFSKMLVATASNLKFGPEVGLGKSKADAPVIEAWLGEVRKIAMDLKHLITSQESAIVIVHNADSRAIHRILKPRSIDAVITSPPYPNEKDYTRTTRLESVFLEFLRSKKELQTLKRTLIRSNTRGVYKGDDDDNWIVNHPEILRIANKIEARRLELGKTSGFERQYHRVTKLYFGGMARHLAELRPLLRKGAHLAYVVGDQASYLRVMIRTGALLADIASSLGYQVVGIDLFRTRFATATGKQLREEVVVLKWNGGGETVSHG